MDKDLLEKLLFEEESATLDCKREQYPFAKATDEEKSELLKDIIGFANAWRRSDAYILIGVEDVRGGRSKIVGIPATAHLDDHSLQQFVNNLTNQPVRFHYEAFGFEEKQVGIINIEQQPRPIYLKRDYGKLLKEKVYVRRGSSTDPSKPASPEEIAKMGGDPGQPEAELLVEFAHIENSNALSTTTSWNAEHCQMPRAETIPDYSPPQRLDPYLGIDLSLHRPNKDYFRELAKFEFARRFLQPIRLIVRNVGQVAASNVRLEISVPKVIGILIMSKSDMPEPPVRTDFLARPLTKGIASFLRRDPGEVKIHENEEAFRIEIDCGDLQPGREVPSDVFYIGKRVSGMLPLKGLMLASNLPKPKEFALVASITVANKQISIRELLTLPEPASLDD